MIKLRRIGHATFETPDLDKQIEHFTQVTGLVVAAREKDRAMLATKLGQLKDLGTARLIACQDAEVAQLLVHDRRLRALCQLAGDRQVVFKAADETTVRRVLKEMGYVLPPP